jgi:hypothetical protein
MDINKEIMEKEAKNFLSVLFTLPEVEKVQIKDVFISSSDDNENIIKGLEKCYHDKYSDVDINAYLKLHPNDFNTETPIYKKYFSRLGFQDKIFGIAFQGRLNYKEGMRICLKNGVRIDFFCFCRCDELAPLLPSEQTTMVEPAKENVNFSANWDLEKADWFWFVAIQALGKLMRRDYLISSHLAHTLIMEGLVAQMVMRDNQYSTNFHRYGYSEKLEYLSVELTPSNEFKISGDGTYNYITELLYQAAASYDKLILQLSDGYVSRLEIFLEIWKSYMN